MAEETKIEDSILNDFKSLKHIKDNSMDNILKFISGKLSKKLNFILVKIHCLIF
jgi:hypothetical protein